MKQSSYSPSQREFDFSACDSQSLDLKLCQRPEGIAPGGDRETIQLC